MKLILTQVRRVALVLLALSAVPAWFGAFGAQTDLPYSSGSTGADGPLTFRTIPVGGRYGHTLAYDSARGKTILFGGNNGSYLADTWSFDGTNWIRLSPTTSPPPRYLASMVYVPWNGGRIILFGGQNQNGYLSDTWSWDGTTWTQINTASSPSARASGAMAYDAERNKIMLFSGAGPGVGTEVWLLDGAVNPLIGKTQILVILHHHGINILLPMMLNEKSSY